MIKILPYNNEEALISNFLLKYLTLDTSITTEITPFKQYNFQTGTKRSTSSRDLSANCFFNQGVQISYSISVFNDKYPILNIQHVRKLQSRKFVSTLIYYKYEEYRLEG